MPTDSATAALLQLLDSHPDRTKMARFRDLAPTVDRLIKAGVKRPALLKVLAEQGLELSPGTLKVYLARWRQQSKERAAEDAAAMPAPAIANASATRLEAELRPAAPHGAAAPLAVASPPEPVASAAPRPPRSISEIRKDPADFEGARVWMREQQRQRKAEAEKSPGPSTA